MSLLTLGSWLKARVLSTEAKCTSQASIQGDTTRGEHIHPFINPSEAPRHDLVAQMISGEWQMSSHSLQSLSMAHDESLPINPLPSYHRLVKAVVENAPIMGNASNSQQIAKSFLAVEKEAEQHFTKLAANLITPGSPKNWITVANKRRHLSFRGRLSDLTIVGLLESPVDSQILATALLVHAIAIAYISPLTVQIIGSDGSHRKLETKQLAEAFATTRIPGPGIDKLKTYSNSSHVIIWANGYAFKLRVLDANRRPIAVSILADQIQEVLDTTRNPKQELNVATLSTFLSREEWTTVRAEVCEASPEAMEDIESAITSIALHSTQPDAATDQLKLAKRDRQIVYSDKTFGFSVFAKGALACRAEHATVDGGVLGQMMDLIHKVMSGIQTNTKPSTVFHPVQEISTATTVRKLPPSPSQSFNRETALFRVSQHPDVLNLLRSKRLTNLVFQLTYQTALSAVLDNAVIPVREPTSVRSFAEGRIDVNYVTTEESIAFCRYVREGNYGPKLLALFSATVRKYKQLQKESKSGVGLAAGILELASSIRPLAESEDKAIAIAAIASLNRRTAFFSGAPFAPSIITMEPFLQDPEQVSLAYIGHDDHTVFSMMGTGKFTALLGTLQQAIERFLVPISITAVMLATIEEGK